MCGFSCHTFFIRRKFPEIYIIIQFKYLVFKFIVKLDKNSDIPFIFFKFALKPCVETLCQLFADRDSGYCLFITDNL